MKVEVEIHDGEYCEGCLFHAWDAGETSYCSYLSRGLTSQKYGISVPKHPDCPSLKKAKEFTKVEMNEAVRQMTSSKPVLSTTDPMREARLDRLDLESRRLA